MHATPRVEELVDAVRRHATTLAPGGRIVAADLAVLDDVIGDARVVAVGESTHFVEEFTDLQRLLITYLVEHHGFTVVAHEFGFAEGLQLDRWVDGQGDDLALHPGVPGAVCVATMDRWRWLREYNATHDPRVRFAGLDTPAGGGSLRPVLQPLASFLHEADPEALDWLREAEGVAYQCEALSQAGAAPLWARLPESDRALLTATLSRLSLRMDVLRPVYRARTSDDAVELARRHLDVALAADHMVAAVQGLLTGSGLPMDTAVRDRLMADSLFWHLDRLLPHDRVVLVAHNLHIQRGAADDGARSALTMGSRLRDTLGDRYRAIALTHTARRAPAIVMSGADPHGFVVTDAAVDDAPPTSVEGALVAAGHGGSVSALRLAALGEEAVPDGIGAQGTSVPTDVATAFDAVVNSPTATMTRHLSLY